MMRDLALACAALAMGILLGLAAGPRNQHECRAQVVEFERHGRNFRAVETVRHGRMADGVCVIDFLGGNEQ